MIINKLNDLYNRLVDEKVKGLATEGYSSAKIGYCLSLNIEGDLVAIISLLEGEKQQHPKSLLVPYQSARAAKGWPWYLCDNASYIFGYDFKKLKLKTVRILNHLKGLHNDLASKLPNNIAMQAVARFFNKTDPNTIIENKVINDNLTYLKNNLYVFVFKMDGQNSFIYEDIGYVLGRLFAVLEKAQATISDRFISSASSSLARVFYYLLNLYQHHISKIDRGKKSFGNNIDKEVQAIMNLIDVTDDKYNIPPILTIDSVLTFLLVIIKRNQCLTNA